MKVAIIDMGTNTFNLSVFDIHRKPYTFRLLFRDKCNVLLGGENRLTEHFIDEEATIRAVKALKKHIQSAQNYGVQKIAAFATSAVREAKNQKEFLKICQAETGLNIKVLSGNEEAEYIYEGVRLAVDIGNEPVLIMDIGGGSTEFVIADKTTIYWRHSFMLGISRLLQIFSPSDPVSDDEIKEICNYLSKETQLLKQALKRTPVTTLIGSSGSFETLVDLVLGVLHEMEKPNEKTKSYHIAIEDFMLISRILIRSTTNERRRMKGMDPMRVELMVLAVIFIRYIILEFNIQSIIQSSYAIKEGALRKITEKNI